MQSLLTGPQAQDHNRGRSIFVASFLRRKITRNNPTCWHMHRTIPYLDDPFPWFLILGSTLPNVQRGSRVKLYPLRSCNRCRDSQLTVDEVLDGAALHLDCYLVPSGGEGGDGEHCQGVRLQFAQGCQL